jgi:hypothetical protein
MTALLTAPYRRGAETQVIGLGAYAAAGTPIPAYDFTEYRARYGVGPAAPFYVLFPQADVGPGALTVAVDYQNGGLTGTATVTVPAGAAALTSFALPLPAGPALRLTVLHQSPAPAPGAAAATFGIVALLGNIAKVAWVLGREKDQLRQLLRQVRQERSRGLGHGYSLDLLGRDLRVPRFPPREYSFDPATLALYHLNEAVSDPAAVTDSTVQFNKAGHPGTNAGADREAPGKFGSGYRFPGAAGAGVVTVPDDAEFSIAAGGGFTVELFVKADARDDPAPRFLIRKGAVDAAGTLAAAGWSLSLLTWRGVPNNVRWAVSDGTNAVAVFADLNVADGAFHHLAGVIDRAGKRARLFVDGAEASSADAGALGAVANNQPVLIGSGAAAVPFAGTVDEVRLSGVARSDFHPALGEGDDSYRRRLGLFQRWFLPTPANLIAAVNDLVQINGDPQSFILVEQTAPTATATQAVRIVPASLAGGRSIDARGDPLAQEAAASGLPGDDLDFGPIYLVRHDRTGVTYGTDPNNRLMQVVTAAALDALADRLAALQPAPGGNLVVVKSYAPADTGLHSVGRALRLQHDKLTPDVLAALAHRAGLSFVRNADTDVYASTAAGVKLGVASEPPAVADTPPPGSDVFAGKTLNLDLVPTTIPAGGIVQWTLVLPAAGRAHFAPHPADDPKLSTPVTARRRLQLVADAPGLVAVKVEYTLQGRTVSGTRELLIDVNALPDKGTIAADGTLNGTEDAAVGPPGPAPNPIYLITSNVAGVTYGADPNNKKMLIALERPFLRLTAAAGALPGLQVVKAYDPAAMTGRHQAGRALVLAHATLKGDRLSALAHQAGFDYVQRQADQVYCSVAAGDLLQIVHAVGAQPLEDELIAGTPLVLQGRFDALPAGGSLHWTVEPAELGNGSFDVSEVPLGAPFPVRLTPTFTPTATGGALLHLTYFEAAPLTAAPYTFEVRFKPALDLPATILPKDQYDLLMNLLNYFHPVGVEVVTANLRQRVRELVQDPLKAFPAYTYPDFRA